MPRPPRKKKAAFDYHALNAAHVVRPREDDEARSKTSLWLSDPANIERLLEAVSGGQSLRRFIDAEGLAYSSVQRALTREPLVGRYHEAQQQQSEHLLGEMERITLLIEQGSLDPKAGSVILDNLQWRMSKFNASRYNDRQVIEQHTYDHTKAHVAALRELARLPLVGRLDISRQLVEPAPVHSADRQVRYVPVGTVEPVATGETGQDAIDGVIVPSPSSTVPTVPTVSTVPTGQDVLAGQAVLTGGGR